MSSRVQKGGTLFRPAAKTRGRQSTETAFQISDDFNNSFPSTLASSPHDASTSMPPPSTIPRHLTPGLSSSTAPSRSNAAAVPVSLSTSTPGPTSSQINLSTRQISTLSKPTAITVPSRKAPTPLVIGQSRQPITTSRSMSLPSTTPITNSVSRSLAASSTNVSVPVPRPNPLSHSMNAAQQMTGMPSIPPGHMQEVYPGVLYSGSMDSTPIPQTTNSEDASRPPKRRADTVNSQEDDPWEPPAKKPRRPRARKSASHELETNTSESPRRMSRKVTARRNNATKSEGSDGTDTSDASPKKTKRRSTTALSRPRKPKGPSFPPYDPEAPGVDLDPTAVTMANLCKDTGQGRVSSKAVEIMNNHIAWKTANREQRARMITIMEARKFGRNLEEEEEAANRSNAFDVPESERTAASPAPFIGASSSNDDVPPEGQRLSVGEPSTSDFDYSQTMSASRFNVQVRIGPNGETVVDEESLFVDTSAEQDTENYTHVEESDTTKFVNSATHSRKYRGYRWTAEETELFFDALAQFGENYELISYVLPGRDRKACKNKFKAEDKKNPNRINNCLKKRVPYDIKTLSRMTGKDFSGPTPVIRAPTPLKMVENDRNASPALGGEGLDVVRKQSQTPGVQQGNNQEEEVLGDVENFDKDDT